jgi:hypothetical protein
MNHSAIGRSIRNVRPVHAIAVLLAGASFGLADEKPALDSGSRKVIPNTVFEVPVLVVFNTGEKLRDKKDNKIIKPERDIWRGGVQQLEIEVERRDSRRPFQLAIAEGNPGDSGSSAKSSIWLATIVAALQRADDLAGVKMVVAFDAEANGPSAGGMICLSLLSVLDGRAVPKDFAFTGGIMPDGTISHVGGMVEKIRAAKQKGISRVLFPSGVRFAEDFTSGDLVDLRKLSRELKIELIPVQNVATAFRIVHRLPSDGHHILDGSAPSTSEENEAKLIIQNSLRIKRGYEAVGKLPEGIRNELLNGREWASVRALAGKSARSFRAGHLWSAYTRRTRWLSGMLGLQAATEDVAHAANGTGVYEKIPAEKRQDALNDLGRLTESGGGLKKRLTEMAGQLEPAGSQFCAGFIGQYYRVLAEWESTVALQARFIQLPEKEEPTGQARKDILGKLALRRLWLGHQGLKILELMMSESAILCTGLPNASINGPKAVSALRFFRTAVRSAHSAFHTEVIIPWASRREITVTAAWDEIGNLDDNVLPIRRSYGLAFERGGRAPVADPGPADAFRTAVNAQRLALSLAEVSGLFVKWNELSPYYDDNRDLQYYNPELLSHLLREARRNALTNILACQKIKVPCPEAIAWLQLGDDTRDDNATEKVDVLVYYWKASLLSQVLRMIFESKSE